MNTKRAASNIMVNQWHAFIIILSILVFPVIANAQTAGFSWGDNGYGQLGDGTEADESNGFFNVKNIPGFTAVPLNLEQFQLVGSGHVVICAT